jgi:hypothetical protein
VLHVFDCRTLGALETSGATSVAAASRRVESIDATFELTPDVFGTNAGTDDEHAVNVAIVAKAMHADERRHSSVRRKSRRRRSMRISAITVSS